MKKYSSYLVVVFVSGIFFISVSAVSAQQRFPATAPQSATSSEEGGKAGIIVVDGTIGSEREIDRSKQPGTAIEPSDSFQPRQPGTRIEPGDIFQPRPGTTLKPGGPDTLQRKDLPRGQRGLGGVIPPDFDDDATNR